MKIKSFFAPNLVNALNIIETLYKNEAVIQSVTSVKQGVKVSVFIKKSKKNIDANQIKNKDKKIYFSNLLKHHNFPDSFIERLVRATKNKGLKPNDDKLLLIAFEELFHFKPIYPITPDKVYLFVGTAGSGKTTVLKKMALQAKKENLSPLILSLSKETTSLNSFATQTGIPVQFIEGIEKLNESVTLARLNSNYILIDTPGINPFSPEDMKALKTMYQELSDGEFILIQPAGLDVQEAIAQGALFYKNGCSLLITTKMDTHVKYIGLCQTLIYNPLQLTGLCFSPNINENIVEATPSNLSKLFLLKNS